MTHILYHGNTYSFTTTATPAIVKKTSVDPRPAKNGIPGGSKNPKCCLKHTTARWIYPVTEAFSSNSSAGDRGIQKKKKDSHPFPGQLLCCTVPLQGVPVQIFCKGQSETTETVQNKNNMQWKDTSVAAFPSNLPFFAIVKVYFFLCREMITQFTQKLMHVHNLKKHSLSI